MSGNDVLTYSFAVNCVEISLAEAATSDQSLEQAGKWTYVVGDQLGSAPQSLKERKRRDTQRRTFALSVGALKPVAGMSFAR